MEIEFELNREDVCGLLDHVIYSQGRWKRLGKILCGSAVFALAGALFLQFINPSVQRAGWILIGAGGIFPIFTLAFDGIKPLRRFVLRVPPDGAKDADYGPKRIEVSAAGIRWIGKQMTTECTWQSIERIELSERQALFYTSVRNAFIVPRRALADEVALNHFVETARRYHREALQRAGEPKPNQPSGATDNH